MKRSWFAALTRSAQSLRDHIRARPDSEFQQSLIRLAIGGIFLIYFTSSAVAPSPQTLHKVYWALLVLFLFGLYVTINTLVSLKVSPLRRYLSMVVDYGVVSSLLIITGEAGTPLLVVYLWVTLGYGFRYGPNYLITSAVLSIVGFSVVLLSSSYWGTHLSISTAFLLSMIAVPLYAVSLLKRLYSAMEREKNANHSKSVFLANMSHELRTPLNGVIGVSDLLNETALSRQQKEYTDIIRKSADTLLELIENVLDISRIEAGRLSYKREDFDLHQVINSTVMLLENQAKTKGLTLAAHTAPQTPFLLHGDARHLRQILINLIGNAIKFTESGRVDVYVRPIGQANPQRLRIEVVDTGIGIPKDAQGRIFDRFTQADTSVTRRYGGTGLGTTIAKQLVEMMGGQIGLHSREGEGTNFWFEIPFELQNANDPTVAGERFEETMRVGILARHDLAHRMQQIIEGWGADTVVVNNTAQLAAELAEYPVSERTVNAVVVERASLLGDPLEFLRLLREDSKLINLPIILIDSSPLSTEGKNEIRPDSHLLHGGFASVLRVPVNPTLLFNAIHAVVSRELPQNVVSLGERFQSQPGTQRLQVLVAEDNTVNQRVIRGLLSHAGFKVSLAQNGEEALSMLESGEHFDIAIIDMHMPELSGPEVIQRWRFMEKGHLPIVMLTADAREDAEIVSKNAGADAFLTKPISSHSLVEVIARLTSNNAMSIFAKAKLKAPVLEVLDEGVLENLALMGGGKVFVNELIENFNEESKYSITQIERALHAEDFGMWHDQLHMLKGGASDVGAHLLAGVCADAEHIKPYEISTKLARERLMNVQSALEEAQTALATYQKGKLRAEHGRT